MRVIGITGGVGSGKSFILDYLRDKYGAYVILTDIVGARLMLPNGKAYSKIVEAFGKAILKQNKEINKEKLASIVFNNKDELHKLNSIVHPLVKEYILSTIESLREISAVKIVVIESALLLDDNYDLICDETWFIHTEEEIRIKRLRDTRGYSEAHSRSIIKNQKSDKEFMERCSLTIDNNGSTLETLYQVDRCIEKG